MDIAVEAELAPLQATVQLALGSREAWGLRRLSFLNRFRNTRMESAKRGTDRATSRLSPKR